MFVFASKQTSSLTMTSYTWVDQKVLKLLAYLFEYTTDLYKTYTKYKVNIS